MMHNAKIEEQVRVNTLSPIVLTKYVVRGMMSAGAGRIVNIASIIGATGYSGLAAYAATKTSMLGFTRSLAREVGRLGINVNAVSPGFLATDMTSVLSDEQRQADRAQDRAAPLSRGRRRGQRGRVSAQRQSAQYHRDGADGRRRHDGVGRIAAATG